MSITRNTEDLIAIFSDTFFNNFNTQLINGELSGDDEPIYRPADASHSMHRIIFAHGYFRSALHECAHWLVAGSARHLLEDYGYWYEPDGRNALQQAEFEKVEVAPQAIEWALCVSCGINFDVSADNLSGIEIDRLAFKNKVYQQVKLYLKQGFSSRSQALIDACCAFYQRPPLTIFMFDNV